MRESHEWRLGRLAIGYGEPFAFHRWREILLALYWRKRYVALYWLDKEKRMSTPVKPIAPIAAAPAPKYYELASPAVVMDGVVEPLVSFLEYLGLVHRVVFIKPLVVTSGRDSVHTAGSLHAEGRAVDFRTKDLLPDEQLLILSLLAYAGPANKIAVFDERALIGAEHIHLEYHGA